MLGHLSFSLRAMPVMVPPVPAPATSMSILPVRRVCAGSETAQTKELIYSADSVSALRTIALLQDLLGCGVVVSQWVAGVTVLIQDVGVGDLVLEAPGDAHMRLGRIEAGAGGRADDLGSESSQDVHLHEDNEIKH